MQSFLNQFLILIKRWWWMVLLGVVICGGGTYVLSKFTPPVYQASAVLVVSLSNSNSVDANGSIATVPTYAQLIANPIVLNPVVAKHPGMTEQQLSAMITVKPQSNTQLIELDVQNRNPQLAAQLANEVSQSFQQYANAQLPASIQILAAQVPTSPTSKALQTTALGALVGLGLAIALIIIFEWVEDHISNPEEVEKLLDTEILATLPKLSDNQQSKIPQMPPTFIERYRMLSANMITARRLSHFKLIVVTSAHAAEGKSTVAINLASFIAMTGQKVLLVDANMRHPTLDQHFKLSNQRGLSTVFLEMWNSPRMELYGQETHIPSLRVLTSGAIPSKPAELLQSELADQLFNHFKEGPFNYVIFDTPPLLSVADAQIMASLVDTVVLVVDAHKTSRRALSQVKDILDRARTPVVGAVINKSQWLDTQAIQQYPMSKQKPQEISAQIMPGNEPTFLSNVNQSPNTPIPPSIPSSRSIIRSPMPMNGTGQRNNSMPNWQQMGANHDGQSGYVQ